jgi:hypothetical protein
VWGCAVRCRGTDTHQPCRSLWRAQAERYRAATPWHRLRCPRPCGRTRTVFTSGRSAAPSPLTVESPAVSRAELHVHVGHPRQTRTASTARTSVRVCRCIFAAASDGLLFTCWTMRIRACTCITMTATRELRVVPSSRRWTCDCRTGARSAGASSPDSGCPAHLYVRAEQPPR